MLEQLAEWFYDPVIFWGTPLIAVVILALVKRVRGKTQGKAPRNQTHSRFD